ncbi:aldehyde dehydrogenase family protein [Nanchangia anserum]|nr:aldehyde dehydrogenase family protein [Nanchangia anserum]QOX81435.1 aldehyde dehydrogenase family protein [Nanchangia anserum]
MIPTGVPPEFLARVTSPAQAFSGAPAQAVQIWTGEELCEFPTAAPSDVVRAVEVAHEAQVRWWGLTQIERWRVFRDFATLVKTHREKLIRLLQVFGGQSRFDAFDQFQDTFNSASQYAQFVKRMSMSEFSHGAIPFVSRLRKDSLPLGTVAAFTLSDYMLSYGAVDIAPILAAGNSVIQFVPAQAYPVSMAVLELAEAAGLPHGAWQVLPAHSTDLGRAHIDLFDHVVYIGNTATGVSLQQQCLDATVGTTMYMSVKNHSVVMADANLEVAVRSVAWQAFMNAGYSSVHIEKVHVDRGLYPDFIRKLRSLVERRIVPGATYDHTATMGSAYSQARFDRVRNHTVDALSLGADILCGGNPRPELGPWFHEPTILLDVPEDALAYSEETYGPVLIVEPFDQVDEVTTEIAHSQYCYGMQIFTEDMALANYVACASTASFVSINDGYHMLWGAWNAPVRGSRDTGTGVRHGVAAIRQFTRQCLTMRELAYTGEPNSTQSLNQWERLSLKVVYTSAFLRSL